MMLEKRMTFPAYLTYLLSRGQVAFTAAQAQEDLGISRGALLDAADRQRRRKHLLTPRRGFYVIVPPQFLSWGAPPPAWYIHDLMDHEQSPYYVGLLKAAELHGATHQAVMEFQVITDKRLPRIKAGRSTIAFYYRKDMAAITFAQQNYKTDTGLMKISGPELTAFDLVRYPHAAGGLDHVVTVLADLGKLIDETRLAELASRFERAVLQRLGYLLCFSGHKDKAGALDEPLRARTPTPWIELEPALTRDSNFTPASILRDKRWHVVVRRMPQIDE
ncbi:MAG: type IV toxin-antitoxin system AbiEi family antitoxin [Pseudomonadales bacterium]